jgi:hypothetical protein
MHFYMSYDVTPGAGTRVYVGSAFANRSRPDVNAAQGVAGKHGFRFVIPEHLDGDSVGEGDYGVWPHSLGAYGIDISGDKNQLVNPGYLRYACRSWGFAGIWCVYGQFTG